MSKCYVWVPESTCHEYFIVASLSPHWQGLVNVLIEHHPTIGDIITNKYLKVMFKIPKTGHLPIYQPPLNHHHKTVSKVPVPSAVVRRAGGFATLLRARTCRGVRGAETVSWKHTFSPLETNPEWMQSVRFFRKFIVDLETHANLWLKLMDVDSDVNIDGSRRLGDLQPSITPAILGCGRTFSKMLDQTSPTGHRHLWL